MRPYYSIPFTPDRLIKKQRHALIDLKQAVSDYIHLILKTHLTELRYDYNFGCYVWDQDYENIQSISKWEDEMENQMKSSIAQYEKRLENLLVKIKVEEPSLNEENSNIPTRFKRRIKIEVSGELWKIKQQFLSRDYIYFSPLFIN